MSMILFADEPDSVSAAPPDPPPAPKEASPEAPPRTAPPPAPAPAPRLAGDRAVIKVIGIGGGGGNSVNRMIEAGVSGVEFIAVNTDAQVLDRSKAPVRIQIGRDRTGGLGCGGDPEQGRLAARDDMDRIIEAVSGADMVFLTVGEGGGTGTGAAPVIACAAQELGALSVAVATKPLTVEGRRRRHTADDGIRELREYVDTLICVPNDRVLEVYGSQPITDAFRGADDVVRQAVQGISDLIQVAGMINLDFADVRTAMRARGDAVMGIGVASGEDRVERATGAAIESPLLEDTSIRGATSILVNVTGGQSLTLEDVHRVMELVREAVAPDLAAGYGVEQAEPGDNIFLGAAVDPELDDEDGGRIQVTVVATGFPDRNRRGATPRDFVQYASRVQATGTDGRSAAPEAPRDGNGSRPNGASDHVESGAGRGPDRRPNRRPLQEPAPTTSREAGGIRLVGHSLRRRTAGSSAGAGPVGDAPPPGDIFSTDDSRWGDLETPAFLRRGARRED